MGFSFESQQYTHVIWLLDLSTTFDFESANIDESCAVDIKKAVQNKNGVIIISGPTGSGKTRTLYTLLNSLEKEQKNIVTLEDPIEYTFERINQIEINEKNLSFSDGLRAILRQDPDVILVGEIRDFETADLCFKAAATGHLVLSSLHANSSTKVVDRLLNLGIDQYIIESNLRFSAAQRLLKKICQGCSSKASLEDIDNLGLTLAKANIDNKVSNFKVRNPSGCKSCDNGIVGRVPVIEYITKVELDFSNPLIPKESLRQATLKLAQKGLVDINEVLDAQ